MPSLMFGTISQGTIPSDENTVRSNTFPVSLDDKPAVEQQRPEMELRDTDPNPNLGLVTRQLAPYYIPSEKYAPFWAERVNTNHDHNDIINRQVGSSGTAAQRELAGEYGHGSTPIAIGIEPTIRDGGEFGNNYFVSHPKNVQATMSREQGVQPALDSGINRDAINSTDAYGRAAAREAAQSADYGDWYRAIVG